MLAQREAVEWGLNFSRYPLLLEPSAARSASCRGEFKKMRWREQLVVGIKDGAKVK